MRYRSPSCTHASRWFLVRAGKIFLPARTKSHLLTFKHKIARDIARVLNALARVIRAIANLVDVINW